MKPEPEALFGQCACGGNLTVYHLRYHCPLRSQQNTLNELWWQAFMEQRLDTAHVAVLGEN